MVRVVPFAASAALAALAVSLLAGSAFASPIFEMRIRAGTYDSGLIAGTIDPGDTSGTVSGSGLAAAGGGGNSFNIGTLMGSFSLGGGPVIGLSGNGIEHLAAQAGTLRISLTLANLDDPLTGLGFSDVFSGTLASSLAGTRDLLRVHLGQTPFATQVSLFDSGQVPSANADPSCGANGTNVFCNFSGAVASVPSDPYSITELVSLTFGGNGNTLNKSGSFSNRLSGSPDATTVPEPASGFLLASALLAAFGGFGQRRSARR